MKFPSNIHAGSEMLTLLSTERQSFPRCNDLFEKRGIIVITGHDYSGCRLLKRMKNSKFQLGHTITNFPFKVL